MKIVVSLQREPEDDALTPSLVKAKSKALIRRCLELLEEWPESEWMTQTLSVKMPKGR